MQPENAYEGTLHRMIRVNAARRTKNTMDVKP